MCFFVCKTTLCEMRNDGLRFLLREVYRDYVLVRIQSDLFKNFAGNSGGIALYRRGIALYRRGIALL